MSNQTSSESSVCTLTIFYVRPTPPSVSGGVSTGLAHSVGNFIKIALLVLVGHSESVVVAPYP